MPQNYSILLPTASPLYAPLYIAKELGMPGFDGVEFEYHQSTIYTKKKHQDKLIEKLLRIEEKNEHVIMAVCDPMRVIAAKLNDHIYDRPLVLSNMISKMCYWFIDGDLDAKTPDKISEKFEKIIVHPPGMTGYTTSFYYLKNNLGFDYEEVEKLLFNCLVPGKERICYEFLGRHKKSKTGKGYLFSTMNPFEVYFTKENGSYRTYLKDDEKCSNSIMTAFISGEKIYEDHSDKINEIIGSVKYVVSTYGLYKDIYAATLHSYKDKKIKISRYWDLSQTKHFLEDMNVSYNIYDSGDTINKVSLENSIEIWADLYHHLGTPDRTVEMQDIPYFFSDKKLTLDKKACNEVMEGVKKKLIDDKTNSTLGDYLPLSQNINHFLILLFVIAVATFGNYKISKIIDPIPDDKNIFKIAPLFENDIVEGLFYLFVISIGAIYPGFKLLKLRYNKHYINSYFYFIKLILFMALLFLGLNNLMNSGYAFGTFAALIGVFFGFVGYHHFLFHLMNFKFGWIDICAERFERVAHNIRIIPYYILLFYKVKVKKSF